MKKRFNLLTNGQELKARCAIGENSLIEFTVIKCRTQAFFTTTLGCLYSIWLGVIL